MNVKIDKTWKEVLKDEWGKPYFKELSHFIHEEYEKATIYPAPKSIFSAFDHCPFDQVKVTILGQDPYHGPGQANGLCFSVADGVKQPPSLQNIFKEIQSDLGKPIPKSGNLERWADQGVLLLNATLTVRAGQAGSHQKQGWEEFTDAVIKKLSDEQENLVFLLWGNYAKRKGEVINTNNGHLILESAHPSPLSAYGGFFGNKHFSQANSFLRKHRMREIEW